MFAVLRFLSLVLAIGFLGACTTLPPPADRAVTTALAPSAEDPLVRVARESAPEGASGFRLMPLGLYALDARIELIRRARSSLDVQYYLIENDRTGRLFMRSLRDAALRGVRVRLLVDDLNTVGADPMFAGLAAFSNVEVRLFNPFCCARESTATRFVASLAEIRRVNHRMHNKLFIADGAIAVMGGRNIADEYFARSEVSNFMDMDVLLVGDVVNRLSGTFDNYWNSPQAYPVGAIVSQVGDRDDLRERFNHLVGDGDQMMSVAVPPMDILKQRPLALEIDAGRMLLASGRAVAFADHPGKVMATSDEMARSMSVQMNVMDRIVLSTRQVVIVSPYFVPGSTGVKAFTDLSARGVAVAILTNSLATNDVPVVHVAYTRYRTELVRAGVDLYELRPSAFEHRTWDSIPGLSHGRLHAKVAVIDDSMVYIGSMNLDPRSESANTELGIVAHCPELARDVSRVFDATTRRSSYRLRLGAESDRLEWLIMGDPRERTLASEPDSDSLLQFRNRLLELFVPAQLL